MQSELAGVGGYASLMKSQKNPYDRDIATTGSLLQSLPQGGGVTGLEGLAKIPLMYQQGVDTANAQQFDQDKANQENQQIQGVMDYQKNVNDQKLAIDKGKADTENAQAKAKTIGDTMDNAKKLAESGNTGEAVKQLNAVGIPATNFIVTPSGNQIQMQNGSFWMPIPDPSGSGKTVPGVWDTDSKQWRPATEEDSAALQKPDAAPKLTGHLVKDSNSSTGYSYAGDDGQIMTKNAPTPAELHPRPPKDTSGADEKRFEFWAGKLQSLQGRIASIQKGFDPITGQVIPQTNIDAAIASLSPEVNNTKRYMQTNYPTQYKTYFGNSGETPQGNPAPSGQVTAVAVKTVNGLPYYKGSDGNWYEGPR
jgi:hypothetical protein